MLDITWAVGHFFNMYVGLHGPRWLNVLGMPPRGCLRLWTPRARATDLAQAPHLRRGVRVGFLRAAESTRKDPRPEEKQMSICKKNTFIHIATYNMRLFRKCETIRTVSSFYGSLNGFYIPAQSDMRDLRPSYQPLHSRAETFISDLSSYPTSTIVSVDPLYHNGRKHKDIWFWYQSLNDPYIPAQSDTHHTFSICSVRRRTHEIY